MSVQPLDIRTVPGGSGKEVIPPADEGFYPKLPPITSAQPTGKRPDPPSYISLFLVSPPSNKKASVYEDEPPSFWENGGCLCQKSDLKYLLLAVVVLFGILYTYEGVTFIDLCPVASSLPLIMGVEGVSLLGFLLLYFFLLPSSENQRKERKSEEDILSKQCHYLIRLVLIFVYITYLYIIWIIGCVQVFEISPDSVDKSKQFGSKAKNESWYCDTEFYDVIYYGNLCQSAVQSLIALIIIIFWMSNPTEKQRFMKQKWKTWFRMLDHDKDGTISQTDMKRTNEKLESIRIYLRQRTVPLDSKKAATWWTTHIFRRGTNSITFDQFCNTHNNFNVQYTESEDFQSAVRRCVTEFFDFFSTHEQGRNHILTDENFVRFWSMLAGTEEKRAREHLKDFPRLLSTGDLMLAWMGFLQNTNRFAYKYYESQAVYQLLK
ncbi:uncharacterized protein LOC134233336 [Saccostrea cucullata]|uniref:uncharacterized protein LOC134233336 n=1 Tax=Saccostrea cuccullata TaxID=36930 RepID=UPI002ED45BD8